MTQDLLYIEDDTGCSVLIDPECILWGSVEKTGSNHFVYNFQCGCGDWQEDFTLTFTSRKSLLKALDATDRISGKIKKRYKLDGPAKLDKQGLSPGTTEK